jgi:hypothetical protein
MAEDTTDPQDATLSGTDPKPATGTPATDATSGPATTEPTIADLQAQVQRMEAALKKTNADAKAHRLENEQLKQFKEQIEASQLSEQEKQSLTTRKLQEQLATLQKERDDVISRHQEDRLNHAIQLHAIKQGLNPEAATRLLDKAALEFDEAGNPANLEAAFKAMVKQFDLKPQTPSPSSGGATNPPRSSSSAQPLSWDIISKMSAEEYRARRIEITQWMASNPMPR